VVVVGEGVEQQHFCLRKFYRSSKEQQQQEEEEDVGVGAAAGAVDRVDWGEWEEEEDRWNVGRIRSMGGVHKHVHVPVHDHSHQ